MIKNRLLLVLLCGTVFALGVGLFYLSSWANRGMEPVKETLPGPAIEKDDAASTPKQPSFARLEEPLNILVIGIDKASPDGGVVRPKPWRSDVLILVHVDPDTRLVNLLSIPRDTRARIPGRGVEKINHAYAYGEVPLTIKAVEELLSIKVDHFICIDYATFSRMVDIIGGIEINVPKDFETKFYDFKSGMQVMNGKQIYNYVTDRSEPRGDIDRIDRQQIFLCALMENIKNKAGAMDLAKMYFEFKKSAETSLALTDTVKLVLFARGLRMENLRMQVLPGQPDYIDNISYWIIDENKKQEIIFEVFGKKPA